MKPINPRQKRIKGHKTDNIFLIFIFGIVATQFLMVFVLSTFAQPKGESVELNGDVVEYSTDGNVVTAKGNVSIFYKNLLLKSDEIKFSRDDQLANAYGNVRLITDEGEIRGEKLDFNFMTMQGDFRNAKIFANPFYGKAEKIRRVSDKKIVMENGYMTTSDYDDPGYRLLAPVIDIYPGDKLVAKNVKMKLGSVPIMYVPRYTQNLKDTKPWLILTPGYDKEWGMFLLSQLRYYKNENFKATLHLDFREKKDVAEGLDLQYDTLKYGAGFISLYYMNERSITSDRFYQKRPTPTIERERFKAQWRHKWQIDEKTSSVLQYYKLSDKDFLDDYFERDHDKDDSPDTYFLLTRNLTHGVLSLRSEARVNRFESKVERLPEIKYTLSNTKLGDTRFYYKNKTSFANLAYKEASPTEYNYDTKRLDLNHEISYPTRVGFVEFKPYIGSEHTYYSRLIDEGENDAIRSVFRTGASLSTKFYKTFSLNKTVLGMDDPRMRHIITPTIKYSYANEPTIDSYDLNQFDSIDQLTNEHQIDFSLENKLQIKREGQTVDLLRVILGTPYSLKEDPSKQGFGLLTTDIDFKPTDFLKLYIDTAYSMKNDYLDTANFDLYINGGDKWSVSVGKRFKRNRDDILTTSYQYQVNKKWAFKIYDRFDVDSGTLQEQDYVITRDLHSWEMVVNFNETRDEGSELLLLFRLKAFPEIGINAGTSFNKRKAGDQSTP